MRKKQVLKKRRIPKIKKDIKDFLLSEEGRISKKNVAKIGISLALLSTMIDPKSANAQHQNVWLTPNPPGGHVSNHTNHSNHGAGGWC